MQRRTTWGLIVGVWGAILLSGATVSAEAPAAVKASPAVIAQAAKRVAAVVAIQSVKQFGTDVTLKTIIDGAVHRVRRGVELKPSLSATQIDSVHLRLKPERQGAALSLQYRF